MSAPWWRYFLGSFLCQDNFGMVVVGLGVMVREVTDKEGSVSGFEPAALDVRTTQLHSFLVGSARGRNARKSW